MKTFGIHTAVSVNMYIGNTFADSDCDDILKTYPNKRGNDGVYNIMDVSDKIRAVYCDMTTDNGGWTVIFLSSSLVVT